MNKNSITLDEFSYIVSTQHLNNQRVGQAMLHRLYDTNKHIANEVSHGAADPFYDDTKIPAFIQWLSEKIAAQVVLPEGFVKFEATENSVCPCNPRDIVRVCLGYKRGKPNERCEEAGSYLWNTVPYDCQIIGYKVEKKYVEPRPMKYSEMPVGQWFMWSNETSEDASIYMKTSRTDLTSVCIKGGGFCDAGRHTNFSENLKFYSVKNNMTRGELLTVKE